jgi:polyisoprenoid-binding protein YceI
MSKTVTAIPGIRVLDGRQVPEVGTWEIDPAHAAFEFVARHLMAKVRGRFPAVTGVATIAERPEDSTLEVKIDASSIDTNEPNRDAHLRSGDFFGLDEHPTISFRSTAGRTGA